MGKSANLLTSHSWTLCLVHDVGGTPGKKEENNPASPPRFDCSLLNLPLTSYPKLLWREQNEEDTHMSFVSQPNWLVPGKRGPD